MVLLFAAALMSRPLWSIAILTSMLNLASPDSILVMDGVLWLSGNCFVMFGFLLLFDGLRHAPEDDLRAEREDAPLYSSLILETASSTEVPSFHKRTYLSDHHPSSSYATDFFIGKTIALVTSLSILLYAEIWHYKNVLASFGQRDKGFSPILSLFIFKLILVVVSLMWIISIVSATWTTGKHLQRLRYMNSRFRQVAFRLLFNYLLLCGALFSALIGLCFRDFLKLSGASMLESFSLVCRGYTPFSSGRFTADIVPFIVFIIWFTAYILLPSSESPFDGVEFGGTSHIYVALQRYAVMARQSNVRMRRRPPREVFCLENACFLLECSWQTYYQLSPRGAAPRVRMDLKRLGLELLREFFCDELSTSGFVAAGEERIVVAFRGSVDSTNIASSLNFAQSPLPSMVIEKSSIVQAIQDCGVLTEENGMKMDHIMHVSSLYGEALSPVHEVLHEEQEGLSYILSSIISLLPFFQQSLPRIHTGFWNAYSSIRSSAMQAVVSAIAHHILSFAPAEPKPLNISFCGHSLGGALCVLAAYEVAINMRCIVETIIELGLNCGRGHPILAFRPTISVYTFGAPRLGNPALVVRLNGTLRNYYRVEIDEDLIPRIPRFLGTYQHGGVQVLLDGATNGNILVKPTIVESQLLRKGTGTVANHTLSKYRDSLESCFEPEELEEYLQQECNSRDSTFSKRGVPGSDARLSPPEWLMISR